MSPRAGVAPRQIKEGYVDETRHQPTRGRGIAKGQTHGSSGGIAGYLAGGSSHERVRGRSGRDSRHLTRSGLTAADGDLGGGDDRHCRGGDNHQHPFPTRAYSAGAGAARSSNNSARRSDHALPRSRPSESSPSRRARRCSWAMVGCSRPRRSRASTTTSSFATDAEKEQQRLSTRYNSLMSRPTSGRSPTTRRSSH